ncbi:conserved hypothetical protein [Sporisorium reilianum SRZ2]|uniref:Zn(2)-C6 fungal-type domain-containing protein n=1 Tax=Sporisorium reilianum (strain SRZ2) TaxID=999809 RepID=E7A123_SPORE|nr:conserved hypothetical protein [Sporisorium reilianum SRZ2]
MSDKPRGLQAAAYRYNCQPCKQRKTKCDRVRPCASCHLRGTQDKCYVEDGDGTAASSPTGSAATAREERPHKRVRISNASAIANSDKAAVSAASLPSVSAGGASPSAVSTQKDSTAAVREHIAMLRKTIDQLEASILPPSSVEKSLTSRSPSSSQGHRDTVASVASTSDLVLTTNDRLAWADVAHLFPPKHDVERILDYFLREMVYITIPVQEKQFWRAWTRLIDPSPSAASGWDAGARDREAPQSGISRPMVASLLMCLASTSFFIPQRREQELELTRPLAEQRDHWIACALALVRCGASFSHPSSGDLKPKPWLHYVDAIADASLDRFGFETFTVRIFVLLGMGEISYHINGECLRRAIRINLFDESSVKAAELLTVDDDELTEQEVVQMRRRIGGQMVVTERWTCLYTGRPPMIDDEAETLPTPAPGQWIESEEIFFHFSRFVSKLRLLPAQLTSLTTRKPGDWSSQRARDQEAVQRVLDMDRGLCAIYDPSLPRNSMGGRSPAQILAELPDILDRNLHHSMSDAHINQLHRNFAEALITTSSWLSLRCLITSNLMFRPWVGDVASRYYALNLARRLIELLPSIWMMASSPYVPFSSSWISRHLFLACTVLSVPILGQETSSSTLSHHSTGTGKNGAERNSGVNSGGGSGGGDTADGSAADPAGDRAGDFAPSRLQNSVFSKSSTYTTLSKISNNSHRLPASSSVDLDWFSGKLVEIASLFSKLAERGDQTARVNTKLIHALLNGRAELRDRVMDKLGQKQMHRSGGIGRTEVAGAVGMGRFESQRDLTTFLMADNVGKASPGSSATGPATAAHAGSPPVARGAGSAGRAKTSAARRDVLTSTRETLGAEQQRVPSPSLHDLANAADTYTNGGKAPTYGESAMMAASTPPLPSFSPHAGYAPPPPQQQQQQHGGTEPNTATTAATGAGSGIGWDWDKTFFPSLPADATGTPSGGGMSSGSSSDGETLTNIPSLFLDTQDWMAILDGVDIPL